MRTLALFLLASLAPSALLAASVRSPLSLIEETEHFRFLAGPSTKGSLRVDAKANERAFVELAGQLGVTLRGKIEYQRLEFPEQVAVFAGDSSLWTTGVAHPESLVIQSTLASHPHEIVHILSHQLGSPSSFFVEGLAVELGDRGKLYGQSVDALARPIARGALAEQTLASFRAVDAQASYALAGSFMRYAVRTWGLSRVIQFFRSSHDGGEDEGRVFEASFGVTLPAALASWRKGIL